MDPRGTLAQGRTPGKQSESWPGLARGVPECSRAAKDGLLGIGPGVVEVGEGNNLNTTPIHLNPVWLVCLELGGLSWIEMRKYNVCMPEKFK